MLAVFTSPKSAVIRTEKAAAMRHCTLLAHDEEQEFDALSLKYVAWPKNNLS